ncbi:hypothetical protein BpHYR1_033625 [Brachionus plicatilis]|uniref:Uncharacterized protein n=1 Tax=Brachionus plicatilis TaxID=10195 RepID=A0A3M7SYW0_BRAPC|nr:hypothetical protein BpHYR1_033625 [Brachionus plicatilis]
MLLVTFCINKKQMNSLKESFLKIRNETILKEEDQNQSNQKAIKNNNMEKIDKISGSLMD